MINWGCGWNIQYQDKSGYQWKSIWGAILDNFLEEIIEMPLMLSAKKLSDVRDKSEREILDKTREKEFHHEVAQLMFTVIWCRKDAQTAIFFLTTRVRKPDEGDWKKLQRLLGHPKQTINLLLILRVDGVNIFKLWVDSSYATHEDMRRHARGTM